jgi:hypothetical protein
LIDVTAYEELKMGETRAAIDRLQSGLALLENAGPRHLAERQACCCIWGRRGCA